MGVFELGRELFGGFGDVIRWAELSMRGRGPDLGTGAGAGDRPAIDAMDAFVL